MELINLREKPVFSITLYDNYVWIGGNGDISLYNIENYQFFCSWSAHDSSVSCLLSVGEYIWSSSASGDIKVWKNKVCIDTF